MSNKTNKTTKKSVKNKYEAYAIVHKKQDPQFKNDLYLIPWKRHECGKGDMSADIIAMFPDEETAKEVMSFSPRGSISKIVKVKITVA